MPDLKTVTIFISSPGDVAAERRRCVLVINRLNQEFGRFLDVRPYLWEKEPMMAGGHFQDIIEPLPGDSDIVVVILWSRLGSPLPARTDKREYHGLDGRVPVTGTEWEVENALQAHAAKGRPDLLVYRNRSEARAAGRDGQALRQAAEQLDAMESFWTRHFKDAETGGFKLGYNSYTSADQFEETLETHLRARLKTLLPADPAAPGSGGADAGLSWYQGSPFRGLRAFDVEHAPIFFGRWQARTQVIDALSAQAERGRAFALVLGASGSGKSSLVRAGVLPLLERPGVTSGVAVWRRCILTPGAHGAADDGDVFDRLALALLERREALPEIATDYTAERLAARLREGVGGDILERALRQVANGERLSTRPDVPPPARLVLVIDQLEEIFTDARAFPPETIHRFARLLTALSDSGVVWVIATLRSDFFHRLAETPALLALADGDSQIHLSAPSGADLEQIIRLPAHAAGLTFEENPETRTGLDTVLREAAAGQDALPLLEFTLDELYRRDVEDLGRSVLTFESYNALGGLEGAIAGRAEAACAALGPDRAAAVDGVLLALAGLEAGEGTEGPENAEAATLRVVAGADLGRTAERAAVVDALVAARLLVSDAGPVAEGDGGRGRTTVRLAHEALLRRWPRYTDLLAREREFLKARGRVTAALGVWLDQDRDPARLLPDGIALAEAEDLLSRRREDLEAAAIASIAYIEASSKAARAQRDRRLRRTRLVAAAMALLAVLSAVGAGGAWVGFQGQLEAQERANSRAAEAARSAMKAEEERTRAQYERATTRIEQSRAAVDSENYRGAVSAALEAFSICNNGSVQCRKEMVDGNLTHVLSLLPNVRILDAGEPVNWVGVSPDGNSIVTAHNSGQARLWDTRFLGSAHTVALSRKAASGERFWLNRFIISADGRRALELAGPIARVFDTSDWSVVAELPHQSYVREGAIGAHGEVAVTLSDASGRNNFVHLWDIERQRVAKLGQVPDPYETYDFWVGDNRTRIAFINDEDKRIYLVEASGGEINLVQRWSPETVPEKISFYKDEDTVLTSRGDHLSVFSIDSMKPVQEFFLDGEVTRMLGAGGGVFIYSSDDGVNKAIWLNKEGDLSSIYTKHGFLSIGSLRNDRYLPLAAFDGTVMVWDTKTGHVQRGYRHRGLVPSVLRIPGSDSIVSGGFDGKLAIMDEAPLTLEKETFVGDFLEGDLGNIQCVAVHGAFLCKNIQNYFFLDEAGLASEIYRLPAWSREINLQSVEFGAFLHNRDNLLLIGKSGTQREFSIPRPDSMQKIYMAPSGRALALQRNDGSIYIYSIGESQLHEEASFNFEDPEALTWKGSDLFVLSSARLAKIGPDGTVEFSQESIDRLMRPRDANQSERWILRAGGQWVVAISTVNGAFFSCQADSMRCTRDSEFSYRSEDGYRSEINESDILAKPGSRDFRIINLQDRSKDIFIATEKGVSCVSFHATLPLLALGNYYGEVRLVNLVTGQIVAQVGRHDSAVTAISFSADGNRILSMGEELRLKSWLVGGPGIVARLRESAWGN
jgi:WD40 repeat protein